MRTLETEIRYQGRTLKQTKREGRVALYELYGAGGVLYGYEVIIVKIHPAESIRGHEYPEREGYPANEDWGTLAWSYGRNDQNGALARFQGLVRQGAGSLPETDLVPS